MGAVNILSYFKHINKQEGFASEVHPHTIWLTRIYFMMFDFITLVSIYKDIVVLFLFLFLLDEVARLTKRLHLN